MRTPYDVDLSANYPSLNAYSDILPDSSRPVIGREKELIRLNAGMSRPELRNIFLIASAGTGKTTLVQGMKAQDTDRLYVEVSLALMTQDLNNPDELAARVKSLFDEASGFRKEHDQELVLFIDEFHLIIQLSKAAVEAIKPYLAASGSRGLLVIAATTKEEYHEYVAANQALTERFQRFDLPEPGRKMTMEILRNEAKRTGIEQFFHDDHLFELIYDYTQRYVPASSQPRKSIKILDSMTGWHRATGAPINDRLLAETIYNDMSVNVAFRVDAEKIKGDLDKRVLSQDYATHVVARRLEVCVADLHDKSRPMSSFIFTGSTGVGKSELIKAMADLLFGDAKDHLIRFDMAEYTLPESAPQFASRLARQVSNHPFAVVMIDEVEKAHGDVTRILLAVLDDGRITDDFGRTVSLLNTYIIMTTNAGSEVYRTMGQYDTDDTGSGASMFKYEDNIRESLKSTTGSNKFPPELLGRVDAIVPFAPLTEATEKAILKLRYEKLYFELFDKKNVRLHIDKRVTQYLIKDLRKNDSDAGGARALMSRFNYEVVSEVARFLNRHPDVRAIRVDVEGQLRSEDKNRLETNAKIVVSPM